MRRAALGAAMLVLGWSVPAWADEAKLRENLQRVITKGELGRAVLLCQTAAEVAKDESRELEPETRKLCAKAYLAVGDRMARLGLAEDARERWKAALTADPELIDDPSFVTRLQTGRAPPPERSPVEGPRTKPGTPDKGVEKKQAEPDPNAGPRDGYWLGVGVVGGFDGIFGFALSTMWEELLAIELSVGLLYPTFDARARVYGHRGILSPVVGVGMLTVFGRTERFGLDLPRYRDLYKLGQLFHIDAGVSVVIAEHLDLFAGMAFLTSVDQDHPDRLLFFPQFALQAMVYF
jgi:hypothetical protein